MAFDGLVMAAVKSELNKTIIGGRVEKIYQPLSLEVNILIHNEGNKFRLLISADARNARIHLTTQAKKNPLTPPLFCMVLRKHLEGGRIVSITQEGLERVLCLSIESVDELGRLSEKKLYCEVMGKHSNIILVDPATNQILDGINRYSYATSRHREVLPGRRYSMPPESGKINPLTLTEDIFMQTVWGKDENIPLDKLLLSSFDGFSPQTCREIVCRAGLNPDSTNHSLGEIDLTRLWQTLAAIKSSVLKGDFHPVLCKDNAGKLVFSAIELTQLYGLPNSTEKCQYNEMNIVLDQYFQAVSRNEKIKTISNQLLKTIKNEIKKCQKKLSIYLDTIQKAEDAELLKIYGELITANLYQISGKQDSVELTNYYDPDGKTVKIELNPQKSPAENAQLYFKRYAKAKHSLEITQEYLSKTKTELSYLETVQVSLEQAETVEELAEIKTELIKEGYLNPENSGKLKKEPAITEPKPLKFITPEGYEIMVGRNNRQNDYLTMKIANPDDTWLHVKDIPGSHVIIRNKGNQAIPDTVMQTAAEIAAYHSRARNSSKVPVDYTLRKNVRKPKGAKPGMVIYDNQQTVYVRPRLPEA